MNCRHVCASMMFIAALFHAGCATTPQPDPAPVPAPAQPVLPAGDFLEVIKTEPATPTRLAYSEHLRIHIRYQVASADSVLIVARPYTGGRRARGYMAHAPESCSGSGEMTGWFTFQGDAQVDEIRVSMLDEATKDVVHSLSQPVQATWGGAPTTPSSNP